jgi:hypothetical protein
MGERVSIQNKTEHVEALKGTPSFFQPGFQSHSQNQNLLVFSIWDLPPQQYTSAQTAATQKPINLLDLITLSVPLKNRVKKVLGYGDLEVPEFRGFCFFGCGRGLNQLLPMGANIGTVGQTAEIFFYMLWRQCTKVARFSTNT